MRPILALALFIAICLPLPLAGANHANCATRTELLYLGTTPPTELYLLSDCSMPDSHYYVTSQGTTVRCEFVPVARVAGQTVPGTGQTHCLETPTVMEEVLTTSNADYVAVEGSAMGTQVGQSIDTDQFGCAQYRQALTTLGLGTCATGP